MIARRRRRGFALVFRISLTTCSPECQRRRTEMIERERRRPFSRGEAG
jgi:hypothetical protein